jgi:hypothetical protein
MKENYAVIWTEVIEIEELEPKATPDLSVSASVLG